MSKHVIELGDNDFLTADTHLGGAPWPYRLWFPKKNGEPTEQLRESFARTWDYQASPDSTIVVVGDALDILAHDVDRELEWFAERPGRKVLIPGNHDNPHPMFGPEGRRREGGWSEVFEIAPAMETFVKVGEHIVPACHYPHSERRQAAWRHEAADQALPVLHGHTHARKALSRTLDGWLQLNVGWPAWRRLAAAPAVLELLNTEAWTIEKGN